MRGVFCDLSGGPNRWACYIGAEGFLESMGMVSFGKSELPSKTWKLRKIDPILTCVEQIIASSKYLGIIPESLGPMDEVSWIPVDVLSNIMTELMMKDSDTSISPTKYYHLENPRSCKWSSLVPVVQEYFLNSKETEGCMAAKKLKSVSFKAWVQELEKSGSEKGLDVAKNPAIKLLEFYQGMSREEKNGVILDTNETCKGSESMKNLKAVDRNWLRLWLEQWGI